MCFDLARKGPCILTLGDLMEVVANPRSIGIPFGYRPYAFVFCEAGCKIADDCIEVTIQRVASREPLVAGMNQHQAAASRPALAKIVLIRRQCLPVAADDVDAIVIEAGQIQIEALLLDQVSENVM